ncbi:helix-turn-helix domain-containing protein [Glutamicibacter sp. NPDC087344]|uniref:helix-turn-helix domain-containing protein n=1 Tax=Glutamicibacter sp. NPDC087344 TaxID=3363994 RepID=UPI0037F3E00E
MESLHSPQGLEIMTRRQAAESIGVVSVKTLANWAARGIGPAYTRIGARTYYRVTTIESWAAAELQKIA